MIDLSGFGGSLDDGRGDPHANSVPVEGLEPILVGATLWGLELDPRYRVLAATVELAYGQEPWGLTEDRRVQLLCSPVSTILASLRRDGAHVVRFELDQLIDVSASFGGAALTPPVFGRPEPRPRSWGPVFSLEGRSTAPDGRQQTATFSVADPEASLDLFVRFDLVEVRDPHGELLTL